MGTYYRPPAETRYAGRVTRTSQDVLVAQAVSAIRQAVESLGHGTRPSPNIDVELTVDIDGLEVDVNVRAGTVITPEVASRLVRTTGRRCRNLAHLAVGDLISKAAKEVLNEAGWGWLDRRGHLVLRAHGVHIDAMVPADERAKDAPKGSISGAAARSWAAALLLMPENPPSMREVARQISMSHSAIVAAAKRLRDDSLVRSDGRPLVPELFWSLADQWSATQVPLALLPQLGAPDPYGELGLNLDGDGTGWAVAGTVGAQAWGAPAMVAGTYPPDFYVASPTIVRQAIRRLGHADRFDDRACTVAVAPTPLVCVKRFHRPMAPENRWPYAHGLFAALDLAQDKARGVEILESWDPKDLTRVW